MAKGESKTIKIASKEAYGPHQDDKIVEINRAEFKAEFEPKLGQFINVALADNQNIMVKIAEISATKMKLDANHPLAGKDLTFDIKLVSIV